MDAKNVNKEWANKVSKADFIKALDHHKDDADLGELWESLQEKKEAAKPEKAK
jgi:hypothetical protein